MNEIELARKIIEDFNNRTFRDTFYDYVDDDVAVVDNGAGMQLQGVDAFIQYSEGWTAAFPDGNAEIVDEQLDGSAVTQVFRARGTFTGEMQTPDGTVPGTGKSLDMEFQQIIEVENGKIVGYTLEYDMQAMMRQLGLG
jgi:steroid delta-isomerase-like uncharacterized protein